MNKIILLTDGSVNTKSKVGFGAYLVVPEHEISTESLKTLVKVKRFENTSSTRLELQTLLWALNEISSFSSQVTVYTDSQNIIGLAGRRKRLEQNNYRSKNNLLIKNYKLYQEYYKMTDQLDIELHKVSGHLKSSKKNTIDQLFTLVDRASRKALRQG